MKKHTIWILAILMAITFIGLLCIQIFYMKNIVQIRYEQFKQGVRQSLVSVAQRLEQDEARYFLEEDVNSVHSSSIIAQYLGDNVPNLSGVKYSFTTSTGLVADLTIKGDVQEISKLQIGNDVIDHYRNLQNSYHNRYLYQKGMIDDVILNIVSSASNRPIRERADSAVVARYLRQELDTLGLRMPFEFAIANYAGTVLYKSSDFQASHTDRDNMFIQALFPNDNTGRLNYLKVYFPTKKDYIFSSISFMVPAFAFTFILLIIFVFTIIVAFRQKKLTEMKNDFINNMTHEFKTPTRRYLTALSSKLKITLVKCISSTLTMASSASRRALMRPPYFSTFSLKVFTILFMAVLASISLSLRLTFCRSNIDISNTFST